MAAKSRAKRPAPAKATPLPSGISEALGRILRPQAAYRWLLPSLAAITPQYIEMTLRGALAGNHVQAWELFDLMEDSWPRLRKNALELKNGVRNMALTFSAYQEEDEETTDNAALRCKVVSSALRNMRPDPSADENSLSGTMFDLCDAWFKGVVVLETDWHLTHGGKALGQIVAPKATRWVHPITYAWGMDGRIGLRADASGRPGFLSGTSYQPMPSSVMPFPADKFLVGISKSKSGSALGGALLRPLAWWWCAANFSADWLLNLAQLFGVPFRMANYDPNAPQATVDSICDMLQNMGASGWGAFPGGTTVEFKEAGKAANSSPQESMLDRADKNCDLLVLGQTLTSDTGGSGAGGGSLALGKVHASVKEEVINAAAGYVCDVFNSQLVPSILRLNFGDDAEAPSLSLVTEKEEDLVQKATMVASLAQAGAGRAIGMNWLAKTFGIPKPDDDEETLSPRSGIVGAGGTPPDQDDEADETDDAAQPVPPTITSDVQATALNGAQVTALAELATNVAQGALPIATAKAIALASFPVVPPATIDQIFAGLASFTPTAADPAAQQVAAKASARLREIHAITDDAQFQAALQALAADITKGALHA
jgi:phage gp29-like protein